MIPVSIVDVRILTALGDLNNTWDAIAANQTGLRSHHKSSLPGSIPCGAIESLEGELGSNARYKQLVDHIFNGNMVLPYGTSVIMATTKGAVDELAKSLGPWESQPWNMGDYIKKKSANSYESISTAVAFWI